MSFESRRLGMHRPLIAHRILRLLNFFRCQRKDLEYRKRTGVLQLRQVRRLIGSRETTIVSLTRSDTLKWQIAETCQTKFLLHTL